eukprot:GEMP01044261.1.p1 GENE.GEMP01044261.1~~GEMP01044261.1.p1  ORF type:complete len:409 (+),score=120.50 GEMP01044261.1:200-1426(+)
MLGQLLLVSVALVISQPFLPSFDIKQCRGAVEKLCHQVEECKKNKAQWQAATYHKKEQLESDTAEVRREMNEVTRQLEEKRRMYERIEMENRALHDQFMDSIRRTQESVVGNAFTQLRLLVGECPTWEQKRSHYVRDPGEHLVEDYLECMEMKTRYQEDKDQCEFWLASKDFQSSAKNSEWQRHEQKESLEDIKDQLDMQDKQLDLVKDRRQNLKEHLDDLAEHVHNAAPAHPSASSFHFVNAALHNATLSQPVLAENMAPMSPEEEQKVKAADRAVIDAQEVLDHALEAQRKAREQLRDHHADMSAVEKKYKDADRKAKASFRVAFALDMIREKAEISYENALLKAKRLETMLTNADKAVMQARRSVGRAEVDRVRRQLDPGGRSHALAPSALIPISSVIVFLFARN